MKKDKYKYLSYICVVLIKAPKLVQGKSKNTEYAQFEKQYFYFLYNVVLRV